MTKPAVRQEREAPSDAVTEVAPGVLRIQLPMNMPGLGHVNCYAMEDSRGIALVDPGLPGPASYRALKQRLASVGLSHRRVHSVIVTHSHPDHYGNANRLRTETGATVITERSFKTFWDPMEEDDEHKELAGPGDADEQAAAAEAVERGRQVVPKWNRPTPWGGDGPKPPTRTRWRYAVLGRMFNGWYRPPVPTRRVEDADVISLAGRDWVAVHTPGHTHDHLCLLDPTEGVFISGDHVLPTITPHISGMVRLDDPLAHFFGSLRKVGAYDSVKITLPAHGHPFDDLGGRTEEIIDHHHERLQILRDASAEFGSGHVGDYSQKLFKPRAWGPMADSETYAHLEHLRLTGEAGARRVEGQLVYEVG